MVQVITFYILTLNNPHLAGCKTQITYKEALFCKQGKYREHELSLAPVRDDVLELDFQEKLPGLLCFSKPFKSKI